MSDPIFNFQQYNPGISNIIGGCFSGHTNVYAMYNEQSNKVSVFKLNEDKPLYTLEDFTQHVTSTYISKNEETLVVGLDSGSVRVYNLKSGKVVRAFSAHRTAVSAISITNSNSFMATGAIDGQVRFWDLDNHQLLQDISSFNALVVNTGKLVSDVQQPEISSLTFNYQQTLLFLGDQSGRVLVWSLQKMQFMTEFFFAKKIAILHVHQLQKLLFVCCQNQLHFIDLEELTLIKTINRNYSAIFTPLRNHVVVGVRNNGLDVYDVNNINTDDFIVQSFDYNFKNAIFCGERKTTTIPQILVLQADTVTNTISIEVCSLKVMAYFKQYLPQSAQQQQQQQQQQQPENNQIQRQTPISQQVNQQPQNQFPVTKPSAVVEHPKTPMTNLNQPGPKQIDQFMKYHNIRLKHLSDKLIMLKQIDNTDPIESAIQVGDMGLFMNVYANITLNKLDLNQATKIVQFLNTQLQLIQNLQVDQVQFIIQTVCKLAQQFSQIVNDTEFAFKNNQRNRDFAVEDRYTRTQEFKSAVCSFFQTIKFVNSNSLDSRIQIKLQAGVTELNRLGWRQ